MIPHGTELVFLFFIIFMIVGTLIIFSGDLPIRKRPFCTYCGEKMGLDIVPNGFNAKTGKPKYSKYWRCTEAKSRVDTSFHNGWEWEFYEC